MEEWEKEIKNLNDRTLEYIYIWNGEQEEQSIAEAGDIRK